MDVSFHSVLENFDEKLDYIKKNDFAGSAFDFVIFYTELFVCLMVS